jgi:hypothetical protein
VTYAEAKATAQRLADETGFDYGILAQPVKPMYRVFGLPRKEYRVGCERLCEVVMCIDLDRCQPGHGPLA